MADNNLSKLLYVDLVTGEYIESDNRDNLVYQTYAVTNSAGDPQGGMAFSDVGSELQIGSVDDTVTNNVLLSSGDASSGNSGNILISTGSIVTGTRGNISLDAAGLSLVNAPLISSIIPDSPNTFTSGVVSAPWGNTYTSIVTITDGTTNVGSISKATNSLVMEGAANSPVVVRSTNASLLLEAGGVGSSADVTINANGENLFFQTAGTNRLIYSEPTSRWLIQNNRLSSLADGVDAGDAVNKSQLDTAVGDLTTIINEQIQGLKPKAAVRAATTGPLTLASDFEAGDTIDTVLLSAGDRILIKDQAAASENGIYVVQVSGAPVRATDFDSLTPVDEINGAYVPVQEGAENEGKFFVQQGSVTQVDGGVGASDINFVFFNAIASGLTGGAGISIISGEVSADVDGETLTNAGGTGAQLEVNLAANAGLFSVGGGNGLAVLVDTTTIEIDSGTGNLRVADLGITAPKIDFGTGANQVDAAVLPIDAISGLVATDTQAALEEILTIAQSGSAESFTVGTGGVTQGDLLVFSGDSTVNQIDVTANEFGFALAATTEAAAASVDALHDGQVLTGVLLGATAAFANGEKVYFNPAGVGADRFVDFANAPSATGSRVWQVGICSDATAGNLLIDINFVNRNS